MSICETITKHEIFHSKEKIPEQMERKAEKYSILRKENKREKNETIY